MRANKLSNVKFGIEVECHIPRGTLGSWGARRTSYHAGYTLGSAGHWRGPAALEDWRAERDGSLPEGRQRMGVEFVSPAYRWPEDLPTMMEAVRALRTAGATTSRYCGGHIHISFDTESLGSGSITSDYLEWREWAAELSYRQYLITEPMANCGWRIGHGYAVDGVLTCTRCYTVGRCTCESPSPRRDRSDYKQCRPGAIYLHGASGNRLHVEARAWKGCVSGSRWAARIGATIELLASDPRILNMGPWARAYRSYHSPARRSVVDRIPVPVPVPVPPVEPGPQGCGRPGCQTCDNGSR